MRSESCVIASMLLISACQTLPLQTKREVHWNFIPALNDQGALAHSQCASIHGNLVAFGGVDDSKGSALNSQLTLYDRKLQRWEIVDDARKPLPRNYASFSVLGQSAFIFGGESAHSNANADGFSFDVLSRQWMELPRHETLIPRKQATLTRVGNELILMGGKGPAPVTNWGRYDVQHQRWTVQDLLPGMTSRVSHIALALDDERLFIWGGFSGEERRGDGFLLNTRTGDVIPLPASPSLTARANARALKLGDEIFIWGGASADGNSNSGAAFHIKNLAWRQLPPIPDPRFQQLKGSEIAVWDNKGFLLFGGRFGSEQFNDKLWYFDTAAQKWTFIRTDEKPEGRTGHCFLALEPHVFAVFGGIGYEKGTQRLTQFDGLWLLEL